MNTGIASVRPQQMQDADRNVSDALQLVPSEFQDVPTDLGSGIRIAPGLVQIGLNLRHQRLKI